MDKLIAKLKADIDFMEDIEQNTELDKVISDVSEAIRVLTVPEKWRNSIKDMTAMEISELKRALDFYASSAIYYMSYEKAEDCSDRVQTIKKKLWLHVDE